MKAFKYLYKVEEIFVITVLIGVSIVIFSQVISRYVFRSPLHFTEELSRYCFIWMVMICAAIGVRRGSHTAVTYFTSFLPHPMRLFLDILRNTAILVFLIYLIYFGAFLAMRTINVRTGVLPLPWGMLYFSTSASAIFMAIHTLKLIWDDIQMLRQRNTQAAEK